MVKDEAGLVQAALCCLSCVTGTEPWQTARAQASHEDGSGTTVPCIWAGPALQPWAQRQVTNPGWPVGAPASCTMCCIQPCSGVRQCCTPGPIPPVEAKPSAALAAIDRTLQLQLQPPLVNQ